MARGDVALEEKEKEEGRPDIIQVYKNTDVEQIQSREHHWPTTLRRSAENNFTDEQMWDWFSHLLVPQSLAFPVSK